MVDAEYADIHYTNIYTFCMLETFFNLKIWIIFITSKWLADCSLH